jgi:hypothetical protein
MLGPSAGVEVAHESATEHNNNTVRTTLYSKCSEMKFHYCINQGILVKDIVYIKPEIKRGKIVP